MQGEAEGAWSRLTELRRRIDVVDASLVETIVDRYRIVGEVGRLKAGADIPALDPRREAQIVRRATESARAAGVPAEGVRQLIWTLLDFCSEGVRSQRSLAPCQLGARTAVDG